MRVLFSKCLCVSISWGAWTYVSGYAIRTCSSSLEPLSLVPAKVETCTLVHVTSNYCATGFGVCSELSGGNPVRGKRTGCARLGIPVAKTTVFALATTTGGPLNDLQAMWCCVQILCHGISVHPINACQSHLLIGLWQCNPGRDLFTLGAPSLRRDLAH